MKVKAIKSFLATTMAMTFLVSVGQGSVLTKANTKNNMKYVTEAFGAIPTKEQVDYQKEELTAFIHFGVNTFTGREWGDGTENPEIFNPTDLDADQWVRTLAEAGFERVILTAKHHDGFCLWDSDYTDHDVASSPWKNGEGDVVKEVSDACAKYGVKFGVYLSPWDQNSEHYGEGNGGDYNEFYMNQLRELLTNYGPIAEVWMDGAKGSNVEQEYKFDEWFALIKELQPECLIFSPQGPDIRWIGNEKGYAGEPCWSTIDIEKMKERENPTYLNHGEEGGPDWVVGESDVSIRPGWFYHASQDNEVKSLEKMMDIYFKSIGRNSVLLLNVPPNKEGKLHENDVNRLNEFGATIRDTFNEDFALNKEITVDSFVNNDETYEASKIVDGDYDTYWAPDNGSRTGTIEIDLGENKEFDVISIQEYIPLGQRISSFNVEVLQGETWNKVYEGETIGYKRLVRIPPTKGQKIRINITGSLEVPLINNVGVYKQPTNIELPAGPPAGLKILNDDNKGTGLEQFNFSDGWVYETAHGDNDLGGDAHYTTKTNATASIKFKGTKFFLSGAKDPSHGIMEVSIDGGETVEVDLYSSERKAKEIVFESEDLTNEEHEVTIKCTGRKNPSSRGVAAHLDGALVLDNDGKGMVDFEQVNYEVSEGIGTATFKVVRKGGSNGKLEVNYDTLPGTALNGVDYQTWSGTLAFNEGETEKTFDITIIDDKEKEDSKEFYLKLSDPIGGILGFNPRATVTIIDDEQIKIETTEVGDGLHQFNFSSEWNTEPGGVWTNNRNATFTIKFKGKQISLVGAKDPNHGIYDVSIDGGEFVEVDAYAESRTLNQVVYESEVLTSGEHTLSFRLKGENPHGGRADAQLNYALVDTSEDEDVEPESPTTDLNKDGTVDIGDLSLASKHYGESIKEYDINGDGIVDEFELNAIMNDILK
ncbi:TPA: alpha-L-fucosidase [Clostridium perfringens]